MGLQKFDDRRYLDGGEGPQKGYFLPCFRNDIHQLSVDETVNQHDIVIMEFQLFQVVYCLVKTDMLIADILRAALGVGVVVVEAKRGMKALRTHIPLLSLSNTTTTTATPKTALRMPPNVRALPGIGVKFEQ